MTTYQRELAPGLIDFACLLSGHEPPGDHGHRYLELGCGRGLSTNIHAAASPGTYIGVDVSPSHIAYASGLAQASGAEVQFIAEDFASFARRDDIEPFDYIVLHGIWSWVSDEVRSQIRQVIERLLRPTGLAYISYDALPGAAVKGPIRDLLQKRRATHGRDSALGLVADLQASGAKFFRDIERAGIYTRQIANGAAGYLEHDYFNPTWRPFHFRDVADSVSLPFVGSARVRDRILNLDLAPEQLVVLQSYGDDAETVRDYLLNTAFRRDLFGTPKPLSAAEQSERLRDTRIALTTLPSAIIDESTPSFVRALLFELARDGAPKRIGDLEACPELRELGPGLLETLVVLIAAGHAHPAPVAVEEIAKTRSALLNDRLSTMARVDSGVSHVASAEIRAGVPIGLVSA